MSMLGSRGGGGGREYPLKNHKNIGFLSITGPDTLINHILGQYSMLGHHWHAGVSLTGR